MKKEFKNLNGKTKIHPTVENLYLYILNEENITPAEALKEFSMIKVYERAENIENDLIRLEKENKRLIHKKNRLEKKINDNQNKIDAIKNELKSYKSNKYDIALEELKPLINNVINQVENKHKFGAKVKLSVIYDIANKYGVDYKKLLKKIDKDTVKKYVENGSSIR